MWLSLSVGEFHLVEAGEISVFVCCKHQKLAFSYNNEGKGSVTFHLTSPGAQFSVLGGA